MTSESLLWLLIILGFAFIALEVYAMWKEWRK